LAAPPRQPDHAGDAHHPEPQGARPASARSTIAGAKGPGASSASATAAGVLAALHAAREAAAASVPSSSEDAAVATMGRGPAGSAADDTAVSPLDVPAVVVAAEPAEPPAPTASRGDARVTRPVEIAVATGDGGAGARGDHGQGGERERPAPVAGGDIALTPPATAPAPFMTANAPDLDPGATSVTRPDTTPSPDGPLPRLATSHVTVELDAEQSGAERVRVAVRGDVVHATVVTDRGGVDAMRPQLDQLRQALEGQGFREAHVQVRSGSGDVASALPVGGVADLRPRAEASSRSADSQSSDQQQSRGRHRGQDQSSPQSRHHEHDEEIL
jgi:hypothetical protein